MSRKKWYRDPLTGLTVKQLDELPDNLLRNDGTLDARRFPDCNLFDVRSIAAAAGFRDGRHFVAHVLTDPSSPFHAHPLVSEVDGQILGYVTHADSASFGGEVARELSAARQKMHLMQNREKGGRPRKVNVGGTIVELDEF